MTSIEWGISISNQRWGEKEGVSEEGRESGRQKEGDSLASDESERERGEGFKRFEGKQKWKKDRMKGWPERERKTHGKKQCAPLIRVKIQQTLRASRLAHFYCSEGGCLLAMSLCFSLQFPTPRFPWPFPSLSNELIHGYLISNYASRANFHSEQIYSKVIIRIRKLKTSTFHF